MLFKDLKERNEIERRYFKLCHFKGKGGSSTTTQTRTIPTQSAEEAQLQGNLLDYDNKSLGQASSILDQAQSALNSVPTVDWNQKLNNYDQTSANNLSSYENTANGNLSNYQNGLNTATGNYGSLLDSIQSAYQQGIQDAASAYKTQSTANLDNYNSQMKDVTQGYTDLSNGILPAAYAAARQKALQDDLTSTVGTSISGLANRGILNSSVTDSALNNISQNASTTLAKNYDNDLATEAGLLGNRATNISNVYSTNQGAAKAVYDTDTGVADKNYSSKTATAGMKYNSLIDTLKNSYSASQDTANSILSARNTANENSILGAAQAQAAAYTPVSNLYNYATQLYNPAQNMYNTMYGGRMGTASTTQTTTTNDGGAEMWQTMGQVGSAIAACFTGDTLITTPDGYKPIKDISVGDDVLSIEDGKIVTKKVTHVNEPHIMPIVDIYFENGTIWHTTESQRYYDGKHFSFVDYMGSAIVFHGSPSKIVIWQGGGRKEPVYDFSVSGLNVFFANDVAAEGYGD